MPRRHHRTPSPVDEPHLRLESEPEFILVEEIRHPAAEEVAIVEPENLEQVPEETGSQLSDVDERMMESGDALVIWGWNL